MDSTKKIKKKIAAHEEKLPWELIEEILSRVCPKSLVRFRIVCKRWNTILDDKTFINNHKESFRFILTTRNKIYSVSIHPKIVVCELTLNITGLESQNPKTLVSCGEFLICGTDKGAAVCNPWLKQSTWISKPNLEFHGIGYDINRRTEGSSVYKTIWTNNTGWKIHDFSSGTWKDLVMSGDSNHGEKRLVLHSKSGVPLNDFLFWIVSSDTLYRLVKLVFPSEGFYIFCDLPCGMSHPRDALVLGVFKEDRFSVLKQCHATKKIEIWVTKDKVNVEDGDDVVWMNFMTFSNPNFPSLVPTESYSQEPSYFIDDKRLVVCSCNETGQAWIYVVGENKLISKVHLDSVVDPWPLHCTYFPSLVPVPRGQRDGAELEV